MRACWDATLLVLVQPSPASCATCRGTSALPRVLALTHRRLHKSPCVRQPFAEISGCISFFPLWFLSRKLCPIFVCQFKGSLHCSRFVPIFTLAQPMLVYQRHDHSSAKQVSLLKESEFNEGPQHYGHEGEGTCKASQNVGARKVDLEGSNGSVLIQARKGWLRSHFCVFLSRHRSSQRKFYLACNLSNFARNNHYSLPCRSRDVWF